MAAWTAGLARPPDLADSPPGLGASAVPFHRCARALRRACLRMFKGVLRILHMSYAVLYINPLNLLFWLGASKSWEPP